MGPGGRRGARRRGAAGALAWLVCGICLVPLARPVGAEPGDPQLAARIFAGLGVRAEIETIVPSAAALLGAPDASDPDRHLLHRIVARRFAPDRLERAGQHAFLSGFESARDLERARIAARWLAQPAVRRLHGALAASPSACGSGETSLERLRLVEAIERTTAGPARVRRHAETVVRNMSAAADALLPASQQIGRIEASPLADGNAGTSAALRACRYAGLSTPELRSALRFIGSDVGRWLYTSVARALDDALAAAARRTARELVEQFEGREPWLPARLVAGPARSRDLRNG